MGMTLLYLIFVHLLFHILTLDFINKQAKLQYKKRNTNQ